MGRVVYLIMVLGLTAGAARLGLRLSPIRLDQYQPAEAIALAALAGLPVLLLGLVLMRLVWSKSAILVRAFEGLGIRCGETELYGGTPSFGFTLCGPVVGADGRAGLVTDDTDARVTHDEPLLHLDEAAGFAELEAPDRAWKLRLSSAPPAK